MTNMKKRNHVLAAEITRHGYRVRDFAPLLGITRDSLSRIINGRSASSACTASRICRLLQKTPEELGLVPYDCRTVGARRRNLDDSSNGSGGEE